MVDALTTPALSDSETSEFLPCPQRQQLLALRRMYTHATITAPYQLAGNAPIDDRQCPHVTPGEKPVWSCVDFEISPFSPEEVVTTQVSFTASCRCGTSEFSIHAVGTLPMQ